MIELISIHIPKTAGTTFHRILSEVYGDQVSPSLKRRDVESIGQKAGTFAAGMDPFWTVLHGHFTYLEIAPLVIPGRVKLITWLREPVDRLVSNYHFFQHRLAHPEFNPAVSALNQHRRTESLLDFARREENRNRMSKFLNGIPLEGLDFIGLLAQFEQDLHLLASRLGWSVDAIPVLNRITGGSQPDPVLRRQLENLNEEDLDLYHRALTLRSLTSKPAAHGR